MRPRHVLGSGVLVVALAFASCAARPVFALEPPARVSVLTMGPGDHPFTRFGHNALLLEWGAVGAGPSAVYNFGTFEFDGVAGVEDFMAGRFRYWLSVGSLESTLLAYGAARRSLTAQELELTAPERAELSAALADNARPEHRYYDYDYYRDNCSTRVRGALDHLLGGAFRRGVHGPGRLTYRQHTRRLVAGSAWLDFGLDLALGAQVDRPISRWDELFLPQELHDELERQQRWLGGQRVPLVRAERELLSARRAPLPPGPPSLSRALGFAGVGALLGATLTCLGFAVARTQRPSLRVAFGAWTSVLGAIIGLLGSALAVLWASKHWAAHDNRNLLACPPWALGLVVLGALFARGKRPRALLPLLTLSLLTTLLLALLSLGAPASSSAALFLPLWAGWSWGAWLALGPAPVAPP